MFWGHTIPSIVPFKIYICPVYIQWFTLWYLQSNFKYIKSITFHALSRQSLTTIFHDTLTLIHPIFSNRSPQPSPGRQMFGIRGLELLYGNTVYGTARSSDPQKINQRFCNVIMPNVNITWRMGFSFPIKVQEIKLFFNGEFVRLKCENIFFFDIFILI